MTMVVPESACVAAVERSETAATHAGEPERPAAYEHYFGVGGGPSLAPAALDFLACSTR